MMALIHRIRWLRVLYPIIIAAATTVVLSIVLPAPLWLVALTAGIAYLLMSPAIYVGFRHVFIHPVPSPNFYFMVLKDNRKIPFEHTFHVTTITEAEAATLIFDHRPIMLAQQRDDVWLEEIVRRIRIADPRISYDSFEWITPDYQLVSKPSDVIIVADMQTHKVPPPSATLSFRKLVW